MDELEGRGPIVGPDLQEWEQVVGRAHDRLYADALGGGAPRSG